MNIKAAIKSNTKKIFKLKQYHFFASFQATDIQKTRYITRCDYLSKVQSCQVREETRVKDLEVHARNQRREEQMYQAFAQKLLHLDSMT